VAVRCLKELFAHFTSLTFSQLTPWPRFSRSTTQDFGCLLRIRGTWEGTTDKNNPTPFREVDYHNTRTVWAGRREPTAHFIYSVSSTCTSRLITLLVASFLPSVKPAYEDIEKSKQGTYSCVDQRAVVRLEDIGFPTYTW